MDYSALAFYTDVTAVDCIFLRSGNQLIHHTKHHEPPQIRKLFACRESGKSSLVSTFRGVGGGAGLSSCSFSGRPHRNNITHTSRSGLIFYRGWGTDPLSPTAQLLIDFLHEQYQNGLGYSAFNSACLAVASLCLQNTSLGYHPLVKRCI